LLRGLQKKEMSLLHLVIRCSAIYVGSIGSEKIGSSSNWKYSIFLGRVRVVDRLDEMAELGDAVPICVQIGSSSCIVTTSGAPDTSVRRRRQRGYHSDPGSTAAVEI
jgi:hypothetical protein